MLLGNIGDDTCGNGENDERHLFCSESNARGAQGRRGTSAPAVEGGFRLGKPPQGPIIKKQQNKGKCNDHRLRQETQNERKKHKEIAPNGGPPDIMGVGSHRKDPEEPAEDVLPFRNPGNRFHVEGVGGKERRHERACPGGMRHEG